MAEIKKISTELQLLDKFLDTSGDAGTSGQVLSSTGTGINWVSGGSLPGGPYLPLSAGSSYPLTDTLYGTKATFGDTTIDVATVTIEGGQTGILDIWRNGTNASYQAIRFRDGTNANTEASIGWASNQLRLNGTSTIVATTGGSERMRIDSSGNVGIGTTSPSTKLDVTDGDAQMMFGSASSARPWLRLQHNIAPADGEEIGLLDFNGFNDANQNTRYAIWIAKAEDVSDGTEDGSLTLQTLKDGTSTNTLTARSGKVGIGTTSPSSKLEVRAETATHQLVSLNRAASPTAAMYLGNDTGNNAIISSNYSDLIFGRDQSSTLSEWMRIKRDGNVGIGVTTTDAKLQIDKANANSSVIISRSGTNIGVSTDVGSITFPSHYNSSYTDYAAIQAYSNALSAVRGSLDLKVKSTSGNILTGMTVYGTNDGINVGIGTTSPGAKLEVSNGSSGFTGSYNGRTAAVFEGSNSSGTTVSIMSPSTGYSGLFFGNETTETLGQIHFKHSENAFTFVNGGGNERMRISSAGNVGIGTTSPAAAAKLTVMGNQTFGLPGSGSNTSGRFISIEGNADGNGEGSSRIFFTEHNSSTAAMDNYGMSLGYRGGATSIVGASGNTWTGLAQIGNGEWGMWGHNNNAYGDLVMSGDRSATYVSFRNNIVKDISNLYVADNIYHTGDTNNYISFGTDVQSFVTNGNSRIYITSTGNVGIGTTSPTTTLSVQGTSSNGINVIGVGTTATRAFMGLNASNHGYLFVTGNSGQNPSLINSAGGDSYISGGNVGIGNTNPSYLLDIGAANIENPVDYIRLNPTNGNGGGTSNTFGSGLIWAPNYNPYTKKSAGIIAVGEGNYFRTGLAFFTNNSASATGDYSERMRIDMDGNVGIGTTNPGAKLEIQTLRESAIRLSSSDITAGADELLSAIDFYSNDTGNEGVKASIQVKYGDVAANSYMTLNTGGNTEQVRITKLGNVGIGTTSPIYKLDVVSAGDGLLSLTGATKPAMIFKVGTSVVGGIQAQANTALNVSAYGTSSLNLQTAGTAPRLTILTGGNVGIGLTNPTSALSINKSMSAAFIADFVNPAVNGHGLLIQAGGTTGTRYITQWKDALGTERFHMEDNGEAYFQGNVGIGTTSPNTQLEIYKINDDPATLRLSSEIADGDMVAAIISFSNDAGGGGVQGRIENVSTEDDTTVFKFYTDNTSSPSMTLFDSGNMTIAGTLTQNSDVRLKENIKPIESALDKVKQMQGVEFNKINSGTKEIGVVAQEIEKIIPELVLEDKEGIKSVAYGNITAVLIEAIKEQQKQIEELKQQLNK